MNIRKFACLASLLLVTVWICSPVLCAESGSVFYFNGDKENPCVSKDEAACSDGKVKTLELKVENLMGVVKKLTGSLKAYAKKGNQPQLKKIASAIRAATELLKEVGPEKNKEKVDEFNTLAGELGTRAMNVANVAEGGSGPAFRAYKRYEDVCGVCHRTFK